jgi:hypothetical protein
MGPTAHVGRYAMYLESIRPEPTLLTNPHSTVGPNLAPATTLPATAVPLPQVVLARGPRPTSEHPGRTPQANASTGPAPAQARTHSHGGGAADWPGASAPLLPSAGSAPAASHPAGPLPSLPPASTPGAKAEAAVGHQRPLATADSDAWEALLDAVHTAGFLPDKALVLVDLVGDHEEALGPNLPPLVLAIGFPLCVRIQPLLYFPGASNPVSCKLDGEVCWVR